MDEEDRNIGFGLLLGWNRQADRRTGGNEGPKIYSNMQKSIKIEIFA